MSIYDYYPSIKSIDRDEIPASPRIDIQLTDPDFYSDKLIEVKNAILDTGADRTLITVELLHAIPISPSGRMRVIPGLGEGRLRIIPYEIGLILNHKRLLNFPVFGYWGNEDVIIGRDILNRYLIHLQGPSLKFTID